jgi:glyoxylase-like metal-dependent hydrolase (beta-lactamase superfamily II)
MTPHGFVKAALAGNATARAADVRGARKTIVTVTTPTKVTLEGTLNDVKANVPFALDVPAAIRSAKPPVAAPLVAERLSEGVWAIPGGARSVAVEFRDHIVIVDAPEGEARSLAVIEAVKKAIPAKPIRYVVNTHSHFDHASGLRAYAADGATIVTHYTNIPYYQQIWAQPRTIAPDRLSRSGRTAAFEGVVGSRTMTDGTRRMVLYHYAGNMHNSGMLMVYLPNEKMLIEADSYTPPANPADPPGGLANLVHFSGVVERLRLDVAQVVPIHGRLATIDDIRTAVTTYGRTLPGGRP